MCALCNLLLPSLYIREMESHLQKANQHLQRRGKLIREMEETNRQSISKVRRLFHPEGDVQMKARLCDQKITLAQLEGAAQM